jgi:glycosyltransferase involved in cell wall biosynthesis
MTDRLVLYAPNVHMGGGLVLLQAMLAAWPSNKLLVAFLDIRAHGIISPPLNSRVIWIKPTLMSRLGGEFLLRRFSILGTTVLCFHGLPPLLPSNGYVVVFQQNRNFFGLNSISQFSFKTRLRLTVERHISKLFRCNVSHYIVQTHSMERNLQNWLAATGGSRSIQIKVFPFIGQMASAIKNNEVIRKWDFAYISHGEAHKNHKTLLQAWQLLAQENLRPSLALTLYSRDEELKKHVASACENGKLEISDLGQLSRANILALYQNTKALIFPSTSESFGLPLIEACHFGLPIIASELDYVRDVCVPTETFDPDSPVSIARAVKRFLGVPEPLITLKSPTDFWRILLEDEHY